MGVVYKARQLCPRRLVALKVVLAGEHAGADALARFRAEAEAAARLQHANVVRVYEVGEHLGRPFLTLEYVDGPTLAQKLSEGQLKFRDSARLLHQLAQAVQFALGRGIIHRDLKPANILLARNEEDESDTLGIPKIADFGLAKQMEGVVSVAGTGPRTQSGAILGTPAYMAPEQAAGRSKEMGPAVDTYALGAILYECLTGRPPFQADSVIDLLMKVATEEPVAPRKVRRKCPRDLETICLKCLEKDPKKRFAGAGELADELDRYLHERPIKSRPAGRLERLGRALRRRKELLYLGVGVMAVLFVGLLLLSLRYPRQEKPAVTELSPSGNNAEEEEPLVALPADLELLPRNAFGFATVRLADVLGRQDVIQFYERLLQDRLPWLGRLDQAWGLEQHTGIKPENVERITYLLRQPDSTPVVLLGLKGPLDLEAVRAAFGKDTVLKPEVSRGKTVYVPAQLHRAAFCAYTKRILLAGSARELSGLLERSAWMADRGPLRRALGVAAGKHPLVVGLHPSAKVLAEVKILSAKQRKALRKLEAMTLVLDLPAAAESGKGPLTRFSGDLRLDFADESEVEKGQAAAQAVLKDILRQADKPDAVAPEVEGLVLTLLAPLRKAQWRSQGKRTNLVVRFRWKAGDVEQWRTGLEEAALRQQSANNLRRIGSALGSYHNRHGHFPPAIIYGKDNKPLYSWRVELLPYLGQEALYKQFRRNERWDSEHNKKLLPRMPAVYAPPFAQGQGALERTWYQVLVGPKAAFEGRRGLARTAFTDGTANTWLVVESAVAVPWTAPQDLPYESGKPLPTIGGHFRGGFNAVFADGRVQFFRAGLSAARVRAYITRNAGDTPAAEPRR
jgi:hypothetical protein